MLDVRFRPIPAASRGPWRLLQGGQGGEGRTELVAVFDISWLQHGPGVRTVTVLFWFWQCGAVHADYLSVYLLKCLALRTLNIMAMSSLTHVHPLILL